MTNTNFEPLQFTPKNNDEMIQISRSFYQNMRRRRTVRDFSDRPIPQKVIMNAILAAGSAPSGANKQPWHFAVVTNPQKKRQIREGAEIEERSFYHERAPQEWLQDLEPFETNEFKPFLEVAPCLIAIFLKTLTKAGDGDSRKNYYTKESVGIATGILITALHLSGLVTLTHTPSPMKFLNEILGRPKTEHPFLLLVTGYPAEQAMVPKIEKYSLDEIASFD
jgi:nitroreductase